MSDEPQEEREELIPGPPADAARKERLAAILRGDKAGAGEDPGVSNKRKGNAQRDLAQRSSMKKSLRGPRKRG